MAEPPFTLPPEASDEGAMARLFINEAAGPNDDPVTTVQAMGWMKRVLVNRLAHPATFGAQGATTIRDIIRAHDRGNVQFAGFPFYPKINAGEKANIDEKLGWATKKGRLQNMYVAFIQAAIEAAMAPAPTDPSLTGLYFWMTSGSNGPRGKAIFFRSLGGNDFYTLPASFFSPQRPMRTPLRRHSRHG